MKTILDMHKTPTPPDRLILATDSFSSVDVSLDSSKAKKTPLSASNSGSDNHANLGKSSKNYEESEQISAIIAESQRILIVQADNPDADSLASSLALEQIFGDMGKDPIMYCGINIPSYLSYLAGWDRVTNIIPDKFDVSIIVDTSAINLFESLKKSGKQKLLASKPCIVIDHHQVENTIYFATVIVNKNVVATGQVIYELANQLKWPMNLESKNMLASSIMSDSLGLISEGTSARSIQIISELVADGVSLTKLENDRKQLMRKSPELLKYKGELLQRVEYYHANKIAIISIPWREIERYSNAYNPSMLVLDDMRLTEGTDVAIAFKIYNNSKVTAKIRCNYQKHIAGDLAKHFGGGGHPYASGFKIENGQSFEQIKTECIATAIKLLDNLKLYP